MFDPAASVGGLLVKVTWEEAADGELGLKSSVAGIRLDPSFEEGSKSGGGVAAKLVGPIAADVAEFAVPFISDVQKGLS